MNAVEMAQIAAIALQNLLLLYRQLAAGNSEIRPVETVLAEADANWLAIQARCDEELNKGGTHL
jgi:hypothetical protein